MKTLLFILSLAVIGVSYLSCGGYSGKTEPPPGRIVGTVLNAESGEPLVGGTVILVDTKLGAMTDRDGRYVIRGVLPGRYSLKIRAIRYISVDVENVVVRSGKDTTVDARIKLKETNIDVFNDPVIIPEVLPDSSKI